MNQDRLEKAFEELSSSFSEGAPATVESKLKTAFRRHHLRRKRQRQATIGLAFISLVVVLSAIIFKSRAVHVQPQQSVVVNGAPKISPPSQTPTSEVATAIPPHGGPRLVAKLNRPSRSRLTLTAPASASFVSLPTYDAAFSDGAVRIVRVNLTKTDLYQMGAPQLSYPGANQTVADVMFDRDGIPIAVRRIGK
jgi:hypothetical protein